MIFAACAPGYFGKFCNKSCPLGKFGDRCGGKCFPRCTNEFCDPVKGCLLIIEKPKHTSKRYKSLTVRKKYVTLAFWRAETQRKNSFVISPSIRLRSRFRIIFSLSSRLNLSHTTPKKWLRVLFVHWHQNKLLDLR